MSSDILTAGRVDNFRNRIFPDQALLQIKCLQRANYRYQRIIDQLENRNTYMRTLSFFIGDFFAVDSNNVGESDNQADAV